MEEERLIGGERETRQVRRIAGFSRYRITTDGRLLNVAPRRGAPYELRPGKSWTLTADDGEALVLTLSRLLRAAALRADPRDGRTKAGKGRPTSESSERRALERLKKPAKGLWLSVPGTLAGARYEVNAEGALRYRAARSGALRYPEGRGLGLRRRYTVLDGEGRSLRAPARRLLLAALTGTPLRAVAFRDWRRPFKDN